MELITDTSLIVSYNNIMINKGTSVQLSKTKHGN